MPPRPKSERTRGGFTLTETMVVLAISPVVLGVIILASVSFQKTVSASELMIRAQASQARLIDYVARDLRNARRISRTVSLTSNPTALSNISAKFAYVHGSALNKLQVRDGRYDYWNDVPLSKSLPSTYLTVTVPGFYQSNVKVDAAYRLVRPLTSSSDYIGYANSASQFAPDVTVQYRKVYLAQYKSECFVRRMMEAGVDEVIADGANFIDLDITALPNNAFTIDAWFIPTFSKRKNKLTTAPTDFAQRTTAMLNSSDQVMLRNPRTD